MVASPGEMWLNFARLVGSKPQDCSIGWSLAEDLSGLASAGVLGTRVGWSFERAHYRSYRAHNYERSPRRLRTWGIGCGTGKECGPAHQTWTPMKILAGPLGRLERFGVDLAE